MPTTRGWSGNNTSTVNAAADNDDEDDDDDDDVALAVTCALDCAHSSSQSANRFKLQMRLLVMRALIMERITRFSPRRR